MHILYNIKYLHKQSKFRPRTGHDGPDEGKAFPLQALGVQKVEAPEFLDSQHRKVVRLSALCTGRLYPQEGFLVLIFVRG
jgi:hypothetical protein